MAMDMVQERPDSGLGQVGTDGGRLISLTCIHPRRTAYH